MKEKNTLGIVLGNRGFFPDSLVDAGYGEIVAAIKMAGWDVIILPKETGKFGSVETWSDAKRCADLFRENRDKIAGVVVSLPNFGDERGVADTLRLAGLNVPVLIQATPDDAAKMTIAHRRDSFCGKISACNNLKQYGIPFSLTRLHTVDPASDAFQQDLAKFGGICRVVNGLRGCRVGALGARPAAFNTVRFSEKILQDSGITVETLDLSEAFGRAGKLNDGDADVMARISQIQAYVSTENVPDAALAKMAKLAIVIDRWIEECELDITAVQCWTSMENYFGVVPCAIMSMLSNSLRSSACEVDVCGALSMHALALASGQPSALLDWNNNYGNNPDKCVLFHCSDVAKDCLACARMDYQEIIAGTVGKDQTYGTVVGRIKSGPMTFARLTTSDTGGRIYAYAGEGEFTDDPLETFGGYGVARIPGLQGLLRDICEEGFEHHVAVSHSLCADTIKEAFDYLGWRTYMHYGICDQPGSLV